MTSWELILAFAAATAVFAYMPGPAMLYTAAQTIAHGRKAGFMAVLGIHTGCYVHVFAATFGLSAIFELVPVLFTIVKVFGALYLIWLGFNIIRNSANQETIAGVNSRSASRAFIQSITVEVLNPKAAIFFIAFLPQFIDPMATIPVWLQFLILGTIVNLTFSSADVLCVLLAGHVTNLVAQSSRTKRLVKIAGGSLLIGLGIHLALAER